MADLYTSLTRSKMELNGGVLPPMTPVPENVQHFIDPELTPGLGAIEEHPEHGLRCPVRGCGRYYQRLSQHIDGKHADIGGQAAVKKALDIPPSAPLITERFRAKLRVMGAALAARPSAARERASAAKARAKGRRRAPGNYANTTGMRNFRNSCEAQTKARIMALHDRLGRPPSAAEARIMDPALDGVACRVYGTWNAALAALGLATIRSARRNGKLVAREAALESLSAWYDRHGCLPRARDAVQVRLPVLHSYSVYLRAFGVGKETPPSERWALAMSRAAAVLGIRGGRYGVPIRQQAEAAD